MDAGAEAHQENEEEVRARVFHIDFLAWSKYTRDGMENIYKALLHSWAEARKRRAVDKKGLVVALIFLVAITLWAGWRRDRTPEQVSMWHEEPDLSTQIEIRPGASREETAWPVSSLTGLKRELDDPRQGQ